MIRPNVHLIAAVANNGGIGLQGKLPWGRNVGDLPWFRDQTMGSVIIMGARTKRALRWELDGRIVHTWQGNDPERHLQEAADMRRFPGLGIKNETVWIAGGAHTYRAFAPFASKWLITRIDYEGPADTFWPFRLPWEER